VVVAFELIISPVHHLQKMTIIFSDVPVVWHPGCWGQGNALLLLDKKVSVLNWISSQKRSIEQAPICGFYFHSCFDLTINGM
jgi:hypothetical protein